MNKVKMNCKGYAVCKFLLTSGGLEYWKAAGTVCRAEAKERLETQLVIDSYSILYTE
jgi:hypothetical protein